MVNEDFSTPPPDDAAWRELARYLRGGFSVDQYLDDHPRMSRSAVIEFVATAVEAAVPTDSTDTPEPGMARDKADVLRRLGERGAAIRSMGVRRLALFGSFARGENGAGSDVDLLVEFEPNAETFRNLARLSSELEGALGRRVELVTPGGLSPHVGPYILAEAEDVALAA